MALNEPRPELDELLIAIGEVGQRLNDIGASEGASGNISVYFGGTVDARRRFPQITNIVLPQAAPALAGNSIIVTGSGRRLRDIQADPTANLGIVVVDADGLHGKLHTATRRRFERVTSEFNSHLAVHNDQVVRTGTSIHALVHAQPPHLTYLSHVAAYRDEAYMNQRLLRWQPEMIMMLPEGLGVLPFIVPGSTALMHATVASLQTHHVVVWSKHGLMARSEISVTRAADGIEYAETAAKYEYMDMVNGGRGEGLTPDELRAVVASLNLPTTLLS